MADSGLIDSNASDVANWFGEQADFFGDDVQEMVQEATDRTYEIALQKVPVDEGDLKDSLTKEKGVVYSELSYAPHVGLGTIYMDGTDYLLGPAEGAIQYALKQLAEKRS
jgi:hypothetical protein